VSTGIKAAGEATVEERRRTSHVFSVHTSIALLLSED